MFVPPLLNVHPDIQSLVQLCFQIFYCAKVWHGKDLLCIFSLMLSFVVFAYYGVSFGLMLVAYDNNNEDNPMFVKMPESMTVNGETNGETPKDQDGVIS